MVSQHYEYIQSIYNHFYKGSKMLDETLQQYATIRQWEYYTKSCELGSNRKTAEFYNVASSAVDGAIRSLKRKAATQGYSPSHDMTRVAPEPFVVRGVSTYYDKEGKASGQWVKTRLDDSKFQELLLEAVEAMKEEIPKVSMMMPPPLGNSSLLNCYVVTDYHLGMLAWHEECGEDWD
jgi:hypothetical protein